MATLSLKIRIDSSGQMKTMQFEPSMLVFDACNYIRQKVQEANRGNRECAAIIYLGIYTVVMQQCMSSDAAMQEIKNYILRLSSEMSRFFTKTVSMLFNNM